eukprot:TRINITY_DN1457_c0_g1_i1.p3 TRINITY_DN1457_c0_g1~~TRINITY_DN1457_c0_g1_i1.p3  ORF type:complete len:134 (-),score=7.98 TRINITY_DN1457_c0_g1_i1:210-611(-)
MPSPLQAARAGRERERGSVVSGKAGSHHRVPPGQSEGCRQQCTAAHCQQRWHSKTAKRKRCKSSSVTDAWVHRDTVYECTRHSRQRRSIKLGCRDEAPAPGWCGRQTQEQNRGRGRVTGCGVRIGTMHMSMQV